METKIAKCKLQNARCKNSKEKEVIGMKRLIGLGLAILLVCGLSAVSFAQATRDVTIYVTPLVEEAFTILPNEIQLGSVDVGVDVSTGNVTPLVITTTGTVTLSYEKQVTIATGWTVGTPGMNVCMLKAAAQNDAPTTDQWGDVTQLEFLTSGYNNLVSTTTPTLPLVLDEGASTNLWFMLDMPESVTGGAGRGDQTITVTIKGTSY